MNYMHTVSFYGTDQGITQRMKRGVIAPSVEAAITKLRENLPGITNLRIVSIAQVEQVDIP